MITLKGQENTAASLVGRHLVSILRYRTPFAEIFNSILSYLEFYWSKMESFLEKLLSFLVDFYALRYDLEGSLTMIEKKSEKWIHIL